MKIGLYDVDSHNFPNLALMKISAWHKQRGDEVEFMLPLMHYDKVYVRFLEMNIHTCQTFAYKPMKLNMVEQVLRLLLKTEKKYIIKIEIKTCLMK